MDKHTITIISDGTKISHSDFKTLENTITTLFNKEDFNITITGLNVDGKYLKNKLKRINEF